MQKQALALALDKAGQAASAMDWLFAGDLLNQCIGSSFGLRDFSIPFFGLYGACSTMGESLALAAMLIDGGFAEKAAAQASSHFCTAERQYRMPVPYGSQRTPTAQWTATAAGCTLLSAQGPGPYITHVTCGKIVDKGITDPNNMGAAMAPAAYDTIRAHLQDTGREPGFYDLIITGDLGQLGGELLRELFQQDGVDLSPRYADCGLMIFDLERQDVHCGGSGCGCSAAVLTGHLLPGMRAGRWNNILFCPTGALHSPPPPARGSPFPGSATPSPSPTAAPPPETGGPSSTMTVRCFFVQYLNAFLCGGVLCAVGQVLLDRTKLTPARILVCYVTAGVLLGGLGLYAPLVEWAGAGATVPLTGFGFTLAKGVQKAVSQHGLLGALTGGISATAGGITAAIFFGFLVALLFRAKPKR